MRSCRPFSGPDGPPAGPQKQSSQSDLCRGPHRLAILGLGPGNPDGLTFEVRSFLSQTQAAVGYGLYLDQARPFLPPDCLMRQSPMTKETQRAQEAIDLARQGLITAVVSGGDSGVYAMAGAVFELVAAQNIALGENPGELSIKVLAGVPALINAAALLGAPLTHDFCAVSLSDRLTAWPIIEKRLDLASQAGFVIAIYNPKSRSRPWQLAKAASILEQNLSPQTPVGLAHRCGRPGQKTVITTLSLLAQQEVDMQTLIIVGSRKTFVYQGFLITPRGYTDKYGVKTDEKP